MITIMKWNDVEMIDGEFYFIDVKRWRDNEPNEWVFVDKDKAIAYCKKYNSNPREYSRTIEEMEVTL